MADSITHNGQTFYLGKRPPDPARRAAFLPFTAPAPIPRSQWKEVNRRPLFTYGDYGLNQHSHGSCVGFSAAMLLMKIRALAGFGFQRLSGAYLYSKINGGSDDGAIISDALTELLKTGTCLEQTAPWDAIYPSRYPSAANVEAQRFLLLEGYRATTFDDIATGLQLDFIPLYAVEVGGNYMNVDSNGVAGFDRGQGNHSVHADGLKKLPSGQWVLDNMGSWGDQAQDHGRCYHTEEHILGPVEDVWLARAASVDPLDVQPPTAIP